MHVTPAKAKRNRQMDKMIPMLCFASLVPQKGSDETPTH